MEWEITVPKAGDYRLQLSYTCANARGAELTAKCDGAEAVTLSVAPTATWGDSSIKTVDMGTMSIDKAGKNVISLTKGPDIGGWQPVDVFELRLIPVK